MEARGDTDFHIVRDAWKRAIDQFSHLKIGKIQSFFGEPLKHVITLRGQILVSRTDADPLPLCVDSKRPRVYVQNVPVCTGTTRACFNTCARGAGIHGDVLNVHTEAFLKPNTGSFSVPQHTHKHTHKHTNTHTHTKHTPRPPTTPRPQRHTSHNITRRQRKKTEKGRQRKRDKTRQDKRRKEKNRREEKRREERRSKTREETR